MAARFGLGSAAVLRWSAALAGVLAVGGGLLVGVATAAGPAEQAINGPQAGQTARPPVRRPLHALIAARLRNERPQSAVGGQRVMVGRLVQLGSNEALLHVGPGQTRIVRVTPQTKLPARRPRPGDGVLAVGETAADGSFVARAVMVRPAAPLRNSGQAPRTGPER